MEGARKEGTELLLPQTSTTLSPYSRTENPASSSSSKKKKQMKQMKKKKSRRSKEEEEEEEEEEAMASNYKSS